MSSIFKSLFYCAILLLSSCVVTTYADKESFILPEKVSQVRIEFKEDTNRVVVITERLEINEFVDDLNHARVNGPWKGASWDKILLDYGDSTIRLSTNGKVFGRSNSGTFYDLDKKYGHYWKEED